MNTEETPMTQQQLEEFFQDLREQAAPKSIELICQHLHCFPIFPVTIYIAAQLFGIAPEEYQQMISSNSDIAD